MRRFFFDPAARNGDIVLLSEIESRHIVKSLRLHVGSQIELLDGSGVRYLAEIRDLGRQVAVRILTADADVQEGRVALHVGQAMLKNTKMDFVVEKCTELGVTSLSPFVSSRCQGKLDNEERGGKRQQRWQRIVESACKQCSRPRPMELSGCCSLAKHCAAVSAEPQSLRLLFWEEEKERRLHDLPPFSNYGRIDLLLGPEGGFSREEVELASQFGYQSISLGQRILRAETATVAAIAIVRYLSGEM
ncbi:MAG: 16S rRNA (uracil(1498)-N(3))-methyltransferase [Desulfobulbaceae bacterium]|jgi:16S rRNA (uracil1498-N3)-methyltransferase|nr:16S rRNA (uracil(1498)-N(3))-methyltransferase [Desulfobulbaceae bacterium]